MVLPCDLQLPLLVSKVQKIPPWIEFIPVSTTEKEEYQQDPDAKNNKAHLLMYLSSRHIGGKNKQAMVSNRSKSTNDNGQKGRDYKNYNRIFFLPIACNLGGSAPKSWSLSLPALPFLRT